MRTSIAIVGGGILGAALLNWLTETYPEHQFTMFEKESDVGLHQTNHNSGVVHAGLYYKPGSLKATLTRRGVELLKQFTTAHNLPYEECGKIILATTDEELSELERIAKVAKANGVPGVNILRGLEEIKAVEPYATGIAALHSPTTAITDYGKITKKLVALSKERGATVHLSTEVYRITDEESSTRVHTDHGVYEYDHVITCAGLQSDRLAKRSGGGSFPAVVPFAGNYYTLVPEKAQQVRGLIYPVPDPAYPFLGIHLTRMIDGEVTVGPNAFLAFKREGYRRGAFSLRDGLSIALLPAFWKFAVSNMRAAFKQITDGTKKSFAKQSDAFVPGITAADLLPGPRGVRAQAMRADGNLEEDFIIEHEGRTTHIRNAPSPAATSSLAIAEHIGKSLRFGSTD